MCCEVRMEAGWCFRVDELCGVLSWGVMVEMWFGGCLGSVIRWVLGCEEGGE